MTTLPSPISWPPSEFWDSDDGPWSTFALRVGTPQQIVRVLPSTAGQATWVVVPQGCSDETTPNCVQSRGGVFNYNQSSTWKQKGFYALGLEANLGYNVSDEGSLYGLETLGLGFSSTTSALTLDSQIVAGFITEDYHVGMFGLGPQPTNFSVYTDNDPSFLAIMKSKNLIPSLSWSYTAGAPYRGKGFFGSLTFGGYDLSRFVPSNTSFSLAPDISRNLVVGLNSITSTSPRTTSFLPTAINTFIDSTEPLLWLPADSCKMFEQELGLELDPSTGLYLLSDELHQNLTDSNWSFTFQITDSATSNGGPTVDIVLPYVSFDLKFTPPYLANVTRYFPIIAAKDESQYTLGRTFLQEAYLITNYEASNFSVSPCRFDDTLRQDILPIPSPNSPNTTTPAAAPPPSRRNHLSGGAIAGITIGSIAFVTLALLLIFLVKRWWWRSPRHSANLKRNFSGPSSSSPPEELESPGISPIQESPVQEMESHRLSGFREMADTGIAELPQPYSKSNTSSAPTSRATSNLVEEENEIPATTIDSPPPLAAPLSVFSRNRSLNNSWTKHKKASPALDSRVQDRMASSAPLLLQMKKNNLSHFHDRPLPSTPRVSQISSLLELYDEQEKRGAVSVAVMPVF